MSTSQIRFLPEREKREERVVFRNADNCWGNIAP
jgi:hypothetical protein